MVIVLFFGVATGLFLGVLNNYLHEILQITKIERGIVYGIFSYYRFVFIVIFVFLLMGIILSARLNVSDQHVQRKRLYFHKKYNKYYILEIFFGARKQVFLTFAPYVLIVRYGIWIVSFFIDASTPPKR